MSVRLFRCRRRREDTPVELPRRNPAAVAPPPAWMTAPTAAFLQPGRVGWLTPAQSWRANGGRW
ncbi:hypothetical protein [Salinispora vitiensis]|uniref:hypothetical protein n=1 Tax=Salinispora vitiensis TaxID=999544 RepID=UPI0009B7C28C|nr:hypothetical protein [Salinispora vitiensis]